MPATHHEFDQPKGNLFGHAEMPPSSFRWQSERTFGYTMAGALIVLQGLWWSGWYQYIQLANQLTQWAGGAQAVLQSLWVIALALAVAAMACPVVLWPINKLWMAIGETLGWVMGRVILSVVYYLVVTPIGWLRLRWGGDPMKRHWAPKQSSYWQVRRQEPFDRQRCLKQY